MGKRAQVGLRDAPPRSAHVLCTGPLVLIMKNYPLKFTENNSEKKQGVLTFQDFYKTDWQHLLLQSKGS